MYRKKLFLLTRDLFITPQYTDSWHLKGMLDAEAQTTISLVTSISILFDLKAIKLFHGSDD
jgi:hypothetical protein